MAKRKESVSQKPPDFTNFNDLCNEEVGGKVLFATDDWFAVAENLLKSEEPQWREGVFTESGKWMDGWETRRRRIPGHDWAIIKLGIPGVIRGVTIDTAYFTGNYPPRISLQAASLESKDEGNIPIRRSELGGAATSEDMEQIEALHSQGWLELIPTSELRAGYEETRYNHFAVDNDNILTHLRLNLYPDGGIARLRIFGEAKPEWKSMIGKQIDLISVTNGGVCEQYSNAHYGHPRNIIKRRPGLDMSDGWETARRPDRPGVLKVDRNNILQTTGHEWAIFKLGHPGYIEDVEVDTTHFKGNFPDSITIEGTLKTADVTYGTLWPTWKTIIPSRKLSGHKVHIFRICSMEERGPYSHVRVIMHPDGGISRLRLWGKLAI